jgi:hypothetical protein
MQRYRVPDNLWVWLLRQASGIVKDYRTRKGVFRAVNGVDLEVAANSLVALLGPSGSGRPHPFGPPGSHSRTSSRLRSAAFVPCQSLCLSVALSMPQHVASAPIDRVSSIRPVLF